MIEDNKNDELVDELLRLRRRVAELEKTKAVRDWKEDSLKVSEARYRSFLENFQGIAYQCDLNFEPVFFRGAVERITGYREEEFVSGEIKWDRLIHEDDIPVVYHEAEKIRSVPNYVNEREYRIICREGEIKWVHEIIKNICDDSMNPFLVQGVIHDITERKKTEKSLKLFSVAVENAPDGVQIVGLDGRITYSNTAVEKIYGFTGEELKGHHVNEMNVDPEFAAREILPAIRETGKWSGELLVRHKDGYEFPVWLSASMVADEKGGPMAMVGIIRDITDRKRLEEALIESRNELEVKVRERTAELESAVDLLRNEIMERRESESALINSEEKYRMLFDNSPLGIIHFDRNGVVTACNDNSCTILGSSREDLIGFDTMKSLVDKKMRAAVEASLAGNTGSYEGDYLSVSGGKTTSIRVNFAPMKSRVGAVEGVVAIMEDITEQKKMRDTILKSREEWVETFNTINDAITIHDKDFNIIRANNAASKLLGLPLVDILSRKCHQSYHGKDSPPVQCPSCRTLKTGMPAVFEVYEPHLQRFIEIKALPRFDKSDTIIGLVHIVSDISARKKAEQNMLKEKEFSDSVINSLPGTFYLFNKQGMILRCNRNLMNVTRYTWQELERLRLLDLFSKEDRENMEGALHEVYEKGQATCEARLVTKDGSEIPYFCNTLKITIDSQDYFIGTGTDISIRKRSEERLQASLKENELLLREIHHRVKNNLQVVCSLFNLQKEAIKDKGAFEMVSDCQNRIRAIALVHEKLYHSKSLANINLKGYIRDLLNNIAAFYEINPNIITIRQDIDDIMLGINSAIPCGLIINELVTNSLQYAFPGGMKGEVNVGMHLDGDEMNIIVRDNGIGMPDMSNMVAETPLGLQIVNALVNQLEGRLETDRAAGTEFRISFGLKK